MSTKLLALLLVVAVAASLVGVNGAPLMRLSHCVFFFDGRFFPRRPFERRYFLPTSFTFHSFFCLRLSHAANAASLSATAEFQLAEVADTFSSAGAKPRFCFAVQDRDGNLVRDQAALRRAAKQFAGNPHIGALCKVSKAKPVQPVQPVRARPYIHPFRCIHLPPPLVPTATR